MSDKTVLTIADICAAADENMLPVADPRIGGFARAIERAVLAASEDRRDAERYRYMKATTTAIRDPETGEREECTPEQFEAAIDAAIAAAGNHKVEGE